MTKTKIDLSRWNRREHYEFFNKFEEPFFGLTTELDCSKAYKKAKKEGYSFYVYYLYQSLKAANEVENFRYRIIDEDVWLFDEIHASTIAMREDGTFGFTFIRYSESFDQFHQDALAERDAVMQSTGLRITENSSRIDVMHYSVLPWIKFSGLSHARIFSRVDSMQKLTFGKIYNIDGSMMLPFSVHQHHALADGKHVGDYLVRFQELLNQ
ncbi:MAG: chloramphenicol acetyltransferase [Marinoscillum sp.]